jgi:hypothetical protein
MANNQTLIQDLRKNLALAKHSAEVKTFLRYLTEKVLDLQNQMLVSDDEPHVLRLHKEARAIQKIVDSIVNYKQVGPNDNSN